MTNIKPSNSVPSTISPFDDLKSLPTYGCFVIFLSVPVCFAPNSNPYRLYSELFYCNVNAYSPGFKNTGKSNLNIVFEPWSELLLFAVNELPGEDVG